MLGLAILLLSCSQLASQIFLPALPQIAESLALSATQSQAMITGYFMFLGVSQLVVGPLRDKFGDRPVFFIGQSIFILGTVLCAVSTSAALFSFGRILQGVGAASPLLISRTLLVATLSGAQLKMAMAKLALVSSCVAILAPLIGGTLTSLVSWQFLAWVLAAYFGVTAIIGWWILPSDPHISTIRSVRPRYLLQQYWLMLQEGRFISIAAFKWLPTFIYLTTQLYFPFLLQQHFQLSEQQFGMMMMFPMSGLFIGALMSKYLHRTMNELTLFALFWPLLICSAMCYIFLPFSLSSVLLGYGFMMVVFGGYFAAYMQLLGVHYAAQTGSANALVGAVELLGFTLLAVGCNAYLIDSLDDLAWITLLVAVVLLLAWCKLLPHATVFNGAFQHITRKQVRSRE
ncbi:hypothetical protein PCIT_a4468 [Pseudoalteromonas citrea]|uniref:Major facilitator superfamily (MFS) profile domain-containing protein n=2 Tax=Pseudoalteromonas citrea TaxID=43655 RepID=A0AAD4AFU0_9GAMM|nr:MFS transporter [Pseudoalteromonas citrea]KAF7765149.1 hypothetical protein PCIT_a4468 [Pseudoalteromonas citrea]